MAMNRVQFQRGLSMAEFFERYGSEDKCEAALVAARWPAGLCLPGLRIGAVHTVFVRDGRRYWQCAACRHQCSLISGTIFEATQAAADALVPGHAPAHPGQEQRLGAGAQAPPGRLLQDAPG